VSARKESMDSERAHGERASAGSLITLITPNRTRRSPEKAAVAAVLHLSRAPAKVKCRQP